MTAWLRGAVAAGRVGAPWESDFPRYAWTMQGQAWYEGRLVNSGQGTYKGYEITPDELPHGL